MTLKTVRKVEGQRFAKSIETQVCFDLSTNGRVVVYFPSVKELYLLTL